ncbi:hypothetical protein EDC04DRAFT_2645238 [Pisolithus marmoratus]|nr:hypothetical protein EDC04DRAFT_2645238 [Pisolithus marmoratus]
MLSRSSTLRFEPGGCIYLVMLLSLGMLSMCSCSIAVRPGHTTFYQSAFLLPTSSNDPLLLPTSSIDSLLRRLVYLVFAHRTARSRGIYLAPYCKDSPAMLTAQPALAYFITHYGSGSNTCHSFPFYLTAESAGAASDLQLSPRPLSQ